MKYIWHKDTNFQLNDQITQIYGVCFDQNGKILIIKEVGKEWNIPGGKPESNETPIQTLKRELVEETGAEIDKFQMIGYFEVVSYNPTIYQLRFACRVKAINKPSPDLGIGNMNRIKFVMANDFFNYVKIEDYRPMLNEGIKWFKKINTN